MPDDDDDDDGSGRDSPNDADLKTLDLGLTLKSDLKNMVKEKTGLYNRLRSIQYDNDFVARICQQVYPHFAVAPNLRCGAWYVKPAWPRVVQHPVYFKSTDGHYNNWDFNLRRANLHLLAAIQDHHGIVIVDSTRKGKRFPDALSKTVPIWCCVLNRAVAKIFGIQTFDVDLHTSPRTVSRSEHSQIEERLDIWAERILQSAFTLPRLSKPLRPIWVSPDTEVPPQLSLATDFHPVVCLSASEMVEDGVERRHGYCYVQGSGDDHESWSQGLSPSTYWRHLDQIVSASHDAIDAVVANIVEQDSPTSGNASWVPIAKADSLLAICPSPQLHPDDDANPVILITGIPPSMPSQPHQLFLTIPQGKAGNMQLMGAIPQVLTFARCYLDQQIPVRVMSDTIDHAVGVAMAILEGLFDDVGNYVADGNPGWS